MQSSKISLVVPCGLQTLLEGVSRAVIEDNPDNIAEFFALYFQDLVTFQKGLFLPSPGMLYFPLECRGEPGFTLFSGEPKQMDKCTDTEEDQLLEEPDVQYSSRVTQHPSTASSIAGSSSPPGSDEASSPEGPELVYIPAESAELAAHMLAVASSEAGQLQPHPNVWTLYCLTDLRQGQKSPPSFPPAGAGGPYYQATLSPSRGEDQQWGQLSQVSAPIYVMQEGSKRENAPPFILVGSNIQNTQDWKPLPSHSVFAQRDAGARRRFVTVPVARAAAEEMDMASCNSQSAEETGAKPRTAHVLSVAIPLDDVMSAKKGSAAGDKRTGINALAGHITVTPVAQNKRKKVDVV
uniref:RIIa domain-containing protein n=1 Tax=Bubo bubo TaxID=30461 RepID=A0A8C0EIC6_BUBBB